MLLHRQRPGRAEPSRDRAGDAGEPVLQEREIHPGRIGRGPQPGLLPDASHPEAVETETEGDHDPVERQDTHGAAYVEYPDGAEFGAAPRQSGTQEIGGKDEEDVDASLSAAADAGNEGARADPLVEAGQGQEMRLRHQKDGDAAQGVDGLASLGHGLEPCHARINAGLRGL